MKPIKNTIDPNYPVVGRLYYSREGQTNLCYPAIVSIVDIDNRYVFYEYTSGGRGTYYREINEFISSVIPY